MMYFKSVVQLFAIDQSVLGILNKYYVTSLVNKEKSIMYFVYQDGGWSGIF